MGRAFDGALAGALPIENGLLAESRFRAVMREQLGLGLTELEKARLQNLGNVLMVPLACAPQYGLIGGFLDQGMFEEVGGLRRQALLVQELYLHQLLQPPLQDALIPRRDRLQQLIRKLAPQRRPELRQSLHRRQAIQPRHQRVVQRGGNRQWRQGPGEFVALLPLLE
jgi:hypothetical protein